MVLDLNKKPVPQEIDRQRVKVILRFIDLTWAVNYKDSVLVIGDYNYFDVNICFKMGVEKASFTVGDLSWWNWVPKEPTWRYNTVFCFDVLEHLINPGLLLDSLSFYAPKADIYITFPTRPSVRYWSTTHFHEYDRDRFETLVDLCGYRIVKEQHVVLHRDWKFYFGFRPLVRLFFQKYTYNLYLIRQK